jgi:DNA-binding MarR family transcriptional regulator
MTAATIPFADLSNAASASAAPPRPANPEWTPSDRDQLVFRWVKFEGKTHGWVAEQLEIHQSTVSRMVERYERWIARGGPARQGGLSHDERLRSQRWLTYERNEWILNSALRLAAEIEKPMDATKSTISRPAQRLSQETEVRTEHMTVDRSGTVARYLRLAHRINMEQLKLVGEEPLPDLEPLTIGDLGEDRLPAVLEESVPAEPSVGDRPSGGTATERMHKTHNAAAEEWQLTTGEANGCDEIVGVEKTAGDAYSVVIYPPETTAPAEGAGELFCLAPRMESVALAIVRRMPGGLMTEAALGGSIWFSNGKNGTADLSDVAPACAPDSGPAIDRMR